MDSILELVMEFLLEGTVEVCMTKSKKVPILLRFLAGVILGVVYGGLFLVFLSIGIANNEPVVIGFAILFFVLILAWFTKSYLTIRKKKNNKEIS